MDTSFDTDYLQRLGVPTRLLNAAPSRAAFPQRFNSGARTIWDDVLDSDTYKDGVEGLGRLDRWELAVNLYIQATGEAVVDAFVSPERIVANDLIGALINARYLAVKYINRKGMFKGIPGAKQRLKVNAFPGIHLSIKQTPTHTQITSHISLLFGVGNYKLDQYFRDTLRMAPIPKDKHRVFYKWLSPEVTLFARTDILAYTDFYYVLRVAEQLPANVDPKHTQKWFKENIWSAVITAQHFRNLALKWQF